MSCLTEVLLSMNLHTVNNIHFGLKFKTGVNSGHLYYLSDYSAGFQCSVVVMLTQDNESVE